VGIIDTREALFKARDQGLDLVEVAPNAQPPVCRIMDYGKFLYAQKKKERKAKGQRHEMEMKEVRIKTPKIGSHDLEIKVNHARDFLERGDKVQFTLRFRGREMAHQDLGREVLNLVKSRLADVSKVERDFRMEGRRLTMVLVSTVKAKPKDKPQGEGKKAKGKKGEQKPAEGEAAAPQQPAPEQPEKPAPEQSERPAPEQPEKPAPEQSEKPATDSAATTS
jgi:translation initiation factor IF-3